MKEIFQEKKCTILILTFDNKGNHQNIIKLTTQVFAILVCNMKFQRLLMSHNYDALIFLTFFCKLQKTMFYVKVVIFLLSCWNDLNLLQRRQDQAQHSADLQDLDG